MTFTIMGRCAQTGRLGMATATRSLAAGPRVCFIRPRLGAVAIMAIADLRLGFTALKFLEQGYRAPAVIDALVQADKPWPEYRQLGVIDNDGLAAARTGQQNRDWAGHLVGDGYISLGNALLGEHVAKAMESSYLANADVALEERLMRALEAGRDAGGQHGGQLSAALLVYDDNQLPRVDLRVDVNDEPIAELRRAFEVWRPSITWFYGRQIDPRVPRYDDWLVMPNEERPAHVRER